MQTDLWEHQESALQHIERVVHSGGSGALLAMGMGAGKTRVAIEYMERFRPARTLVIAPKAVVAVWAMQFVRFSRSPRALLTLCSGSIEKRSDSFAKWLEQFEGTLDRGATMCAVTNYESVGMVRTGKPNTLTDGFLSLKWDLVICDEVHRIKAAGGIRSRLISRIGDRARFRLGLTGTPMPHSPLDIYGQFRFLDKEIFGTSFLHFRGRYAIMGGFEGRQVIGYQNQEELAARMGRVTFRVKTENVLSLPEAVHMERTCDMSPECERAYREMAEEFVAWVKTPTGPEPVTAANALAKLTRLHQLSQGHIATNKISTHKRDLLVETLREIESQDGAIPPLVIFCKFREDLEAVHSACEEVGVLSSELSGDVNELAEWQAGRTQVLVAQIQCGSEGVDLTRSSFVIYYSIGFSLGMYDQSLARIRRPGQTKTCRYLALITVGSIDAKIYQLLVQRRDVVEGILQTIRTNGEEEDGGPAV